MRVSLVVVLVLVSGCAEEPSNSPGGEVNSSADGGAGCSLVPPAITLTDLGITWNGGEPAVVAGGAYPSPQGGLVIQIGQFGFQLDAVPTEAGIYTTAGVGSARVRFDEVPVP